jgi:hypothetical protein
MFLYHTDNDGWCSQPFTPHDTGSVQCVVCGDMPSLYHQMVIVTVHVVMWWRLTFSRIYPPRLWQNRPVYAVLPAGRCRARRHTGCTHLHGPCVHTSAENRTRRSTVYIQECYWAEHVARKERWELYTRYQWETLKGRREHLDKVI